MRVNSDKVVFEFKTLCECEESKAVMTMPEVLYIGTPSCPDCGMEMDLLTTCEVKEDGGFW